MRKLLLLAVAALLILPGVARGERRYLVPGRVFPTLIADPRWPKFETGFASVLDSDSEVFDLYDDLWPVAFGDTIALYAGPPPSIPLLDRAEQFEIGLQPVLFATLDLGEVSQPLVNADYQAGLYVAGRRDNWTVLTRIYHQSSHLGDELLLSGPPVQRSNYSYEVWEVLASYDRPVGEVALRLYGGGGWIFHDLGIDQYGDLSAQYGLELTLPSIGQGVVTPFAAADVQHLQTLDWQADVSVRLGVEVGDPTADSGRFRFSVDYYDGRNVSGQFFTSDIRTVGVSATFTF